MTERAERLACSGKYSCWQDVKDALEAEGFADAGHALNHHFVRVRLDFECAQAKGEPSRA